MRASVTTIFLFLSVGVHSTKKRISFRFPLCNTTGTLPVGLVFFIFYDGSARRDDGEG